MAYREYIGSRYVPIFGRKGEQSWNWDNNAPYEPLTVVSYNGNSYTSRQYVPAGLGTPDTLPFYWAETGNYNTQIEEYRREVLGFDGRITANEDDISLLKESRKFAAVKFTAAYIDGENGDDDTAELNDENHPFKSLEAATEKLLERGNNLDFRFLTPGRYYLPVMIFNGCSIHFRAVCQVSGSITIIPSSSITGVEGLYFYDTHINFMGTEANRIVLDAGVEGEGQEQHKRLIEEEGSTFWCSNTDFICHHLYMIQGGAFFWNCTLEGYLTSYLANMIIRGLEIDNQVAYPALRFSTGVLRTFDTGITIKKNNSNAQAHSAIYVESAIFAATQNITSDPATESEANVNYNRFIDCRSSVVSALDSWITTWNNLGYVNDCQFISLSILLKANTTLEGN